MSEEISEYQKTIEEGRLGHSDEETWNADKPHEHAYCGSKVHWRHKKDCSRVGDGDLPPDTPVLTPLLGEKDE